MKILGVTVDKTFVVKAALTGAAIGVVGLALRWAGSQVGGTAGDLAKKAADVID